MLDDEKTVKTLANLTTKFRLMLIKGALEVVQMTDDHKACLQINPFRGNGFANVASLLCR